MFGFTISLSALTSYHGKFIYENMIINIAKSPLNIEVHLLKEK